MLEKYRKITESCFITCLFLQGILSWQNCYSYGMVRSREQGKAKESRTAGSALFRPLGTIVTRLHHCPCCAALRLETTRGHPPLYGDWPLLTRLTSPTVVLNLSTTTSFLAGLFLIFFFRCIFFLSTVAVKGKLGSSLLAGTTRYSYRWYRPTQPLSVASGRPGGTCGIEARHDDWQACSGSWQMMGRVKGRRLSPLCCFIRHS